MKNLFSFYFVFLLVACASDSQSDLILPLEINNVTYIANVKEIIDANCIVCHNSGANPIAPFPLETYIEVRDKAEFGALLFRIQLPDGDPSIMPKTGKMPQQFIDVILDWTASGFLEN